MWVAHETTEKHTKVVSEETDPPKENTDVSDSSEEDEGDDK